MEQNLLAPHLETLINMPDSGFDVMVDGDKLDDLQRLYRLYVLVSTERGPQVLKAALKESIVARGRVINSMEDVAPNRPNLGDETADGGNKSKKSAPMQAVDNALKWVQDSLELKEKFDKILVNAFDSDKTMQTAIVEALETFVNSNGRAPEYISLFIDENLKKGLKGVRVVFPSL